ncbi:MAG: acetyl-CoA carboxylase carboxyltransferase subunit alpha [Planctomycetes bacterium]|nr:acetyl-CoA carboxylase carboxyltransferase subunit alpha [Planctomycetota bacterium]
MAKALQDRSDYLDFERPVVEIEQKIEEFETLAKTNNMDFSEEINRLHKRRLTIIRDIFRDLTPWQRVELARHPKRPQSLDYIERIFPDFLELAGDRAFADDAAILTGPALLGDIKVMLIAQHKGRDMKESIRCNWGSAHPEGYRKALEKMRLAEKFRLPIVSLIDTKGAYPGIDAEERGQAVAIATNLREMSALRTPIVCVVLSEGGSGGALGIGIGDHVAMMENAYYSVISPEGCAAILWKDAGKAPEAAAALKLTPADLTGFGIVDAVIPEPPGGAHRDPDEAAANLKQHLISVVLELSRTTETDLLARRYEKYRRIGFYADLSSQGAPDSSPES